MLQTLAAQVGRTTYPPLYHRRLTPYRSKAMSTLTIGIASIILAEPQKGMGVEE
jgi:hypothetical protein